MLVIMLVADHTVVLHVSYWHRNVVCLSVTLSVCHSVSGGITPGYFNPLPGNFAKYGTLKSRPAAEKISRLLVINLLI